MFISKIFADEAIDATFSDISFTTENSEAIQYLKKNKIVDGYPDGSFKPLDKINRAEFTKIVINSRYTKEEIENCISENIKSDVDKVFFPDVLKGQWFVPYICLAKVKGIISGYPDGTFKPEKNIAFVEEAKIIVNVFGFEVTPGPVWYEEFVKKLDEMNAIPRTIQNFNYEVNRSEMSEAIFRLKAKKKDKLSLSFDQLEKWSERDSVSGKNLEKLDLENDVNKVFYTDNVSVFYKMGSGKNGSEFIEMVGSDPDTFKILGSDYEGDKNRLYYLYARIDGAKVNDFKILKNSYVTDGYSIYYLGDTISKGELSSFNALDDMYAKIGASVFYSGRIIDGADADSFKLITSKADPGPDFHFCGKDKNAVYCEGYKFSGVDPDTFNLIEFGIGKDKDGIHCNGSLLPVDIESFEVIENANTQVRDRSGIHNITWSPWRLGCKISK